MSKIHLRFVNDAHGLRVLIPWTPGEFRNIASVIVFLAFSAFWAMIAGWPGALLMSPVSLYAGLAFFLNRREVRIGDQQVSWLDRPIPVKRSHSLARDTIQGWVHGPSPDRADPNGPVSEAKIFAAGALLKDGGIVRLANRISSSEQAQEIAERIAKHCGQACSYHNSMLGTHEVITHTWIDTAEWVFKIGLGVVACWQLYSWSQN
jgi:hypothetical protein